MAKRKLPANIRQKKNGVYEARKVIKGVPINLSNTDLDQLIKDFELAKKAVGYAEKLPQTGELILDDWFEEWFDNYKAPAVKESSVYPMKNKYYRTFGAKIGKMQIKDIRNIHIQSTLRELKEEGKTVSTLREALGRVRECLESAKNNLMIPINPCFDIVVPWKSERKEQRFLSVREQNLFLDKAKTEQSWYYPMLMIMFQTGLRVGEVGGLKWEDIDFKHKEIHVRRSLQCQYEAGIKKMMLTSTKTINSVRDIPFIGNVEEMLVEQKATQTRIKEQLGERWRSEGKEFADLVFTTSMGSPATRYSVEKVINKVVKAVNFEENLNSVKENREPVLMASVHPHAIRRTFCTRCFEANMNPKAVQKLMGHATYSTTIDIYTTVMKDRMDYEIDKFELGYTES